jgi:hypothetical protein
MPDPVRGGSIRHDGRRLQACLLPFLTDGPGGGGGLLISSGGGGLHIYI